jgi:hypothetical protein
MTTITEDYVSFEIAKLLKEKGFDELCYQKYDDEGYLSFNHVGYINSDKPCDDFYALAPTLQMAMKWLREKHGIYIDISIYVITKDILKYNINVYYKNDSIYLGIHLTKECSKYEQACEAAIKYCLENLIDK